MRVGVEKKPLRLVVLRAKWPRASGGGDGFAARALRSTNPARAPGTAGNAAYDDTCGSINAIAGQVAEKISIGVVRGISSPAKTRATRVVSSVQRKNQRAMLPKEP